MCDWNCLLIFTKTKFLKYQTHLCCYTFIHYTVRVIIIRMLNHFKSAHRTLQGELIIQCQLHTVVVCTQKHFVQTFTQIVIMSYIIL